MRIYQKIAQLVSSAQHCNEEWANKAVEELEELVLEYLPHGSGFDSGCEVDVDASKSNRVIIHTSFHHMSEYGFYTGWTEHDVIVTPSMTSGFDIRVTGRNTRDDIKSYIAETFDDCLSCYYDASQDTESRLRRLAEVVDHFLCHENTFAELKAANAAIQSVL